MTIAFRCEHCGKLLRAQGAAAGKVRCENCGKAAEVPAGLLTLPQVRLPAHVPAVCTVSAKRTGELEARPDAAAASQAGEPAAERSLAVVERLMPLVFSLFFHLGLILVTVFLGTLVITHAPAATGAIEVPEVGLAEGEPAGQLTLPSSLPPSPGEKDAFASPYQKVMPHNSGTLLPGRSGGDGQAAPGIKSLGLGGPVGGERPGRGLNLGDGPDGSRSGSKVFVDTWLRTKGRVGQIPQNVIYVVDRSGSMASSFDSVREEMFKSIGLLEPNRQLFHVILFSDGQPLEPADRRLVPPTPQYVRAVTAFLTETPAKGSTDPLPALTRAFDILDKATGTKVVFLLTDSQFPQPEKVLQLLRQRNAKKDVRVFPILYGRPAGEAEQTMRKIAEENGHTNYKQVDPDE